MLVDDELHVNPTIHGDDVSVHIKSGEFPVGLVLNEETGEITGTAIKRVSDCQVEIEAVNLVGKSSKVIVFHIQLLSTAAWIIIVILILIVIAVIAYLIYFYQKKKNHQLPITNPPSKKHELKRQIGSDGNTIVSSI